MLSRSRIQKVRSFFYGNHPPLTSFSALEIWNWTAQTAPSENFANFATKSKFFHKRKAFLWLPDEQLKIWDRISVLLGWGRHINVLLLFPFGHGKTSKNSVFAIRFKPESRLAKNGFFDGSKTTCSRYPIKKVRPLSYCNHPPDTLISTLISVIGVWESPHQTFFVSNRFFARRSSRLECFCMRDS